MVKNVLFEVYKCWEEVDSIDGFLGRDDWVKISNQSEDRPIIFRLPAVFLEPCQAGQELHWKLFLKFLQESYEIKP